MPKPVPPPQGLHEAPSRQRMDAGGVLAELERLHQSLEAGAQFPAHRELVRRINAPERSISWALEEMARRGKIIKRLGRGGSLVAHPAPPAQEGAPSAASGDTGEADNPLPCLTSGDRTVIAITEPDGNIFDQAMQLLMKQANSAGLTVACHLLSRHEADRFSAPSLREGMRRYLVVRRENQALAERLLTEGHRVVLVGTPFAGSEVQVPLVAGDQEHGGYLAMKHLLELGHRRIAVHLFMGPDFDFENEFARVPRFAGYRCAIQEAREDGLHVELSLLAAQHGGEYHGQVVEWGRNSDKVRQYFSAAEAPTAIASWNDDLAIRLLSQLQRACVRVPEDVSLVGYDNLGRGASMHPSLTTVDGLLGQQIRAALRILEQEQAPGTRHTIVVLPSLVQRESTAPPPPR